MNCGVVSEGLETIYRNALDVVSCLHERVSRSIDIGGKGVVASTTVKGVLHFILNLKSIVYGTITAKNDPMYNHGNLSAISFRTVVDTMNIGIMNPTIIIMDIEENEREFRSSS